MLPILGYVVAIIIGLITFGWIYSKWEAQYFKRFGLKSPPTMNIPLLGHLAPILFGKTHLKDVINESYEMFPNEKYVGLLEFGKPIILLRDLELIKQVTIKEFDSFHDHISFLNWDSDPLFSKNLFSMKGQRWKEMRPSLSPAFTSSKMRGMYGFILECADQFIDHISEEWLKQKNNEGILEMEMKDPMKRYSGDVIASCAFGIRINSFKDKKNTFLKMALRSSEFTSNINQFLLSFFYFIASKILPNVKSSAFSKDVRTFFSDMVTGSMAQREKLNIVRPDMIHLLMQAKKGKLRDPEEADTQNTPKWTDDELTAQAIIFIIGGLDTSSYLMSFMAIELANHLDIQKKLKEEIDSVYLNCNGNVTYNDLNAMKYLDMVVSETLRKWSQAYRLDRKCVREFELPPPNEHSNKTYKLKPGDGIWIPVNAIHMNPKYYPNPEIFDPERFSDENKDNINQLTYLPFGIGPRNCIGNRFALMETKAVMFHLLLKYDIIPTSKTKNPIEIDPKPIAMTVKGGFWVGLKPRTEIM